MKEVLKILIPIGVVFAIFGTIGYALSGWLFWVTVLGIPTLVLGFLQMAYQVDIRLIWLMDDKGQYDQEKGIIWAIARTLNRRSSKIEKTEKESGDVA